MRATFRRGCLIIVPECYWAGHEADLLVVTEDRRLIDVEIKISRADLRADLDKDKWWQRGIPWSVPWRERDDFHTVLPEPRRWPPKIWKHYYCMPRAIWTPELAEAMRSTSGVLLISGEPQQPFVEQERKATPNRKAEKISPEDCLDIARLAGLRMWEAKQTIENLLREYAHDD